MSYTMNYADRKAPTDEEVGEHGSHFARASGA